MILKMTNKAGSCKKWPLIVNVFTKTIKEYTFAHFYKTCCIYKTMNGLDIDYECFPT